MEIASLTYDRNRGILYGSSKSTLYQVDPATAAVHRLGDFGIELMHAIEYHAGRDVLYGINLNDQPVGLWTIDTGTGAASFVGSCWDYVTGMAHVPDRDVMYASRVGAFPDLVTVDLDTGATVLVAKFDGGDQVGTALAYHADCGLFAADNHGGFPYVSDLYRVDPDTAHVEFVGQAWPGNLNGLAFVPEPAGLALLALASLALMRRRRR